MVNCTKHSLEKYASRIKNIIDSEVKEFVYNNKDLIVYDVNKMYNNSKLIYTGAFNDNSKTNFRLADNIVIVTDLQDTKVITLYRATFGFGREADKAIIDVLIKDLHDADIKYNEACNEVKEKKEKLLADKTLLKEEINTLRDTLKSMEEGLKGIENYIDCIAVDEIKTKAERDIVAKKIVYSNIYRKAVEEYTE